MAQTTTSSPGGADADRLRVRLLRVLGTGTCAARAQTVVLENAPLTIGRAGHAAGPLALADDECSREHARLSHEGDRWSIEDLGSRNGTFVDGKPISQAPLADGSVIRVGQTLMVFVDAEVERAEELAAPRASKLVGQSVPMLRLHAEIALVAPHPVPVLILGETGVGKEVVAEELHRQSGRSGPFVPVNCAAISANIAESELFGHVAGAFSGAGKATEGLFAAAHGGTLFLDEIGEMPMDLQPKVLRALAKGEVRPVGGTQARTVDVRVIAATHRTLADPTRFREDLLARLSGWKLAVPPLRERRDDVVALALAFIGGKSPALGVDAAEALVLHGWPFNVRELEQVVNAALVRARGKAELRPEHLPPEIAAPLTARRPASPSAAAELPPALVATGEPPSEDELRRALERFGGNVARVAELYGKDRQQIYRWARRFGIDMTRYRAE